jgi:hypothetical protein
MPRNGLAVDAQFPGNPPLGPATLVQRYDRLDHGHLEPVRLGTPPSALGLPTRLPHVPDSPQNGWFSCAHDWLVLSAH